MEIKFENILPGKEDNFEIHYKVDMKSTKYDIKSMMHYQPTAFSRNGLPTIVAKNGVNWRTTKEPTETDLAELNMAYQCSSYLGMS